MNKLTQYFTDKKSDVSVAFPVLTKAEEKEVITQLGLPHDAFDKSNAEDVIRGTINRMKQYGPALSVYARLQNESQSFQLSTIRIKRGDEEAVGMIQMKDNEEFGTVKFFLVP